MASTAPALRVALADDSVLLREGLVRLLADAGMEVDGAFGDANALLAALPILTIDVVVLDVRMPPTFRDEGVRAARGALATCSKTASCHSTTCATQ